MNEKKKKEKDDSVDIRKLKKGMTKTKKIIKVKND